jgi:hypothetical protein
MLGWARAVAWEQ